MTTFLASSCLRGRAPRRFRGAHLHERPTLVARMAANRSVARFLIAPNGYGKSCLAALYAKMMFGYQGVVWMDAFSPYFLRDLDLGVLGESILSAEKDLSLLVLDNLPPLSPPRASELSRLIDVMLAAGCEVVVTCSPGSDYYARHQPDRACLRSEDLLVEGDGPLCSEIPADQGEGLLATVPLLHWRGSGALKDFVRGMASEPLPSKMIRGMFLMLVIGRGERSLLERVLSQEESLALFGLAAKYPHLGVSISEGRFETVRLPLNILVQSFRRTISDAGSGYSDFGLDEIALGMADELVSLDDSARACELVQLLASHEGRMAWTLSRGKSVLAALCLEPLERLLASLRMPSSEEGQVLRCLRSYVLARLGDESTSSQISSRVFAKGSKDPSFYYSALLLARFGPLDQRTKVKDLFRSKRLGEKSLLSDMAKGLICEEADLLDALEDPGSFQSLENAACALCWASEFSPLFVAPIVKACFQEWTSEGSALSCFMLSKACLRISEEGSLFEESMVEKASLFVAEGEAELERQRRAYSSRGASPIGAQRKGGDSSEPLLQKPGRSQLVPMLDVRLIGSLDVHIGEERVDPKLYRRKNVRALLALLVLSGGREVSRDRIIESMWPQADLENGRKNIYTVTSRLRKAISLPDGSCPYFHRVDAGFKLDPTLLTSDVGRVRSICERLRFEPVDVSVWEEDLAFLRSQCLDDVLPGESGNSLLRFERSNFSMRLVDALLIASSRLLEQGERRLALWYAQAAFEKEQEREDVYLALMKAQVACGQRESAIETYQANRRFLASTLGLDPSAEIIALYHSVRESEESF